MNITTTIIVIIIFLFGITFGVLFSGQIIDFAKGQNDMIYSCDNSFNSDFYNCPLEYKLKNATGYYCRGHLICQNLWRKDDAP